jgi:hypothetical protein
MKFLNISLTFAGEVPANHILYIILWVLAGERRARIDNAAEESHGWSGDGTLDLEVIDQHLSHCVTRTYYFQVHSPIVY